jgi:hypothetical protein
MTGKAAIHAASGEAFEERAEAELAETVSEEADDVDA